MESSFLFRLNQDEIQGCFLFPQEFFQIQFQGLLTKNNIKDLKKNLCMGTY